MLVLQSQVRNGWLSTTCNAQDREYTKPCNNLCLYQIYQTPQCEFFFCLNIIKTSVAYENLQEMLLFRSSLNRSLNTEVNNNYFYSTLRYYSIHCFRVVKILHVISTAWFDDTDARKYHEFIRGIVYKCKAWVNNSGGNEQVIFRRYCVLLW